MVIQEQILKAFEHPSLLQIIEERLARHNRIILPGEALLDALEPEAKDTLINNPEEFFEQANLVIKEHFTSMMNPGLADNPEHKIPIRIKHLPDSQPLQNVRIKQDAGRLRGFSAQLAGISKIIPYNKNVKKVCPFCGTLTTIPLNGETAPPKIKCRNATCRQNMNINANDIEPEDSIHVLLQSPSDSSKVGQLSTYTGRLIGDMCSKSVLDTLQAGSKINITSIVKITGGKEPALYFEINYIENADMIEEGCILSPDENRMIQEWQARSDLVEYVSGNLYDEYVYGNQSAKIGLLLACIGSPTTSIARGRYMVLLLGDPSSGKSQLLWITFLMRLHHRMQFADGSEVSKAGLVSTTTYDELLKMWINYPGVLPLAHNGVAIIDEADKIEPDKIASINGVIESGIAHVTKAASSEFPANTSILLAANPTTGGRFDPAKDFVDQITMPNSTITRCDFIFIFKHVIGDDREKAFDKMFDKRKKEALSVQIEHANKEKWSLYRRYVNKCRTFHPFVSEELRQFARECDKNMSKMENADLSHKITLRQADTLLRVSQTRARMYWRDSVVAEDLKWASEFVKSNLEELGHAIGVAGVENVYGGRTPDNRNKAKAFIDLLRRAGKEHVWEFSELCVVARENLQMNVFEVDELLEKMRRDSQIFSPTPTKVVLL